MDLFSHSRPLANLLSSRCPGSSHKVIMHWPGLTDEGSIIPGGAARQRSPSELNDTHLSCIN
jgi:hypothetical protein